MKDKSKTIKKSGKKKSVHRALPCSACDCKDYESAGSNKCKCGHSSQRHG